MCCFPCSFGFEASGWGPENYFSTGVLEPYKNMLNLAHFEQFQLKSGVGPLWTKKSRGSCIKFRKQWSLIQNMHKVRGALNWK